MENLKFAKAILVALVACAANAAMPVSVHADDAQENKELREQMRVMMQRMDDLQKQVQALTKQQAAPAAAAPAPAQVASTGPAAPAAAKEDKEPRLTKLLSGFFGTLDVSFDDTTKGMNGFVAYHLLPNGTGLDYSNPKAGGAGPVGRVNYMPALSTNKSTLGYRGSHKIEGTNVDFIYQIQTAPAITMSPGLNTSQYQQSNVTKAGIGYGDTFIGLAGKEWGKVKFGTTYSPYKSSTDRMNPFSGMLGDYAVVMGNSGGDNRVEFGTRLDHSIWYESPVFGKLFSFDLLFSPGQNRTYNNVVQSSGSPDCNGSNMPGSGNLLLNCDDGGFDDAFSADLKFETGGLYVTAAYEVHKNVNRNSDGIGSNSPIYGALPQTSPLLDQNYLQPSAADCASGAASADLCSFWANGGTQPYANDIGNETAFKVGAQYKFDFGLAISGIYETLHRTLPDALQFQNERQRNGLWFALSQDFSPMDNLSIGWAHAGKTPGDPGGQHNFNPATLDDSADMYTIAWKHKFDKSLYWYIDAAETFNHGNAHYDIGAGGRGLTTDCHDGTNAVEIDYSSAGNTTWGGCHEIGVSTGLNYKF
jgi:predicted porin